MALPSFTITGTLYDLLGNVAAGEIVGNGLGGATPATVTFTPNVPAGYFVTFGGVAYRVDPVTADVNSDGTITRNGDPVLLLANDGGLSVDGVQWQAHVTGMNRFWFNAPVDGGTVNLASVAPVPGVSLVGLPSLDWNSVTGKPTTLTTGPNVANGYAGLDGSGKIGTAQLPTSAMEYKGTWNAGTNSPTLADGTGNTGDLYRVGTAGTRSLGSGSITFAVGDDVVYNGSTWEKIGGSGGGVAGLVPTAVKTTSYTAAVNDLVICDVSAAFSVTLPAAPADGARVGVKVVAPIRPSITELLTVVAGGSDVFNKAGGSTTLTLPMLNQAMILQYKASTGIWYVVSTDVPLGGTDNRYRNWVSFRDYGVSIDGTTDDTTRAQAAIDGLSAAGGGTLWWSGTMVVSKLTLKPKVSIVGVGSASILKAKSGVTGTDFGVIEMAQGQIDSIRLAEFSIVGNGNSGQWGIYLYADKGAGSTGGLYQSNFTHLNILAVDNGIWFRGGRTGSVEPHQFINLDSLTIQRTAAGGGTNLKCTGQVNQIQRRNCLFQSASVGSTRTGTAMYFGRDPNYLADSSGRYPQGHSGVLDSVQGANWLVDIESGANLVFQTPYCENALNVFRVRSVNVSNPTDVTIINPRYAAVATTTEVPTTGGTLIDIGDYCDVRVKGPGFISPGVGTIPTPYVIQNDSTSGGSAAFNLSVEGFITNALDTPLFNVPYPVKTMTNAGTASVATMGAWKAIRFRGRGTGAASLATIQGAHAPGESLYFVVTSLGLDINNTDNIILPGGASLVQMAVGDQGRFTKFYDGTSFKWRLEQLGVAVSAATAGSAAKWTTARTVNGVSVDGSANVTIPNVKRPVTPTVAATYTIDITATDVYIIGTVATPQNVAITNITTTGTIADTLTNIIVRIKGDATPHAITWDSAKIATTASAPLPPTTVASKTILVGLMPDAVLGKLVCVSVDAVGY